MIKFEINQKNNQINKNKIKFKFNYFYSLQGEVTKSIIIAYLLIGFLGYLTFSNNTKELTENFNGQKGLIILAILINKLSKCIRLKTYSKKPRKNIK